MFASKDQVGVRCRKSWVGLRVEMGSGAGDLFT